MTKSNEDIAIVEEMVCIAYNIDPLELQIENRGKQSISEARQVIIYLCLLTDCADNIELSEYFKRDRTTILYADKTIKNYLDIDRRFRKKMEDVTHKTKVALSYKTFSNFSL